MPNCLSFILNSHSLTPIKHSLFQYKLYACFESLFYAYIFSGAKTSPPVMLLSKSASFAGKYERKVARTPEGFVDL